MTKPVRRPDWIAGLVLLPEGIGPDGTWILTFIIADGPVIFTELGTPDELLAGLRIHIRKAITKPLTGRSAVPARVRTASPELARALPAALPSGVGVIEGETPEMDIMLDGMKAHLAKPSKIMDLDLFGALHTAAARLFRSNPWPMLPDESPILVVKSKDLGIEEGVLLFSEAPDAKGFVFLEDADDFPDFVDASEAFENDDTVVLPAHIGVTFTSAADAPTALQNLVRDRGWELAGPDAFPTTAYVEDNNPAPLDNAQLKTVEAILLGLAAFFECPEDVAAAFSKEIPVAREIEVREGIKVIFEAAEEEDDEEDSDSALLDAFEGSPEAAGIAKPMWTMLLSDIAGHFFEATPTTIKPADLEHFLLELIPKKVAAPGMTAGVIVAELRAFYTFVKRVEPTATVDAHLALLTPAMATKLAAALNGQKPRAPKKSAAKKKRR